MVEPVDPFGGRDLDLLDNSLTMPAGTLIDLGATATVEVTELDRSENVNDKIRMSFRVVSVNYGGRTEIVEAARFGQCANFLQQIIS